MIKIDITTGEKYHEYAKMVAETIFNIFKKKEPNLELNNLINLIPPFKKPLTIDNWFDAACKEDLEIFKVKDLKYILSVNCKKITGKKSDLINRVWNIYNPTSVITSKSKKRRNKKKKDVDSVSVEDSDDDEQQQLLCVLNNSINIYLKNNTLTKEHKQRYKRRYIIDNNWVFKEYPDRYEYLGILDNNKLVKTPIPDKIENYLLCA